MATKLNVFVYFSNDLRFDVFFFYNLVVMIDEKFLQTLTHYLEVHWDSVKCFLNNKKIPLSKYSDLYQCG